MLAISEARAGAPDDVCLLVEGTYPYVAGGVSAWVHDIIKGHPELRFSVFNIGSTVGAYGPPSYALPDNVTRLHQTYCSELETTPLNGAARARLDGEIRAFRRRGRSRRPLSRVLGAIRRLASRPAGAMIACSKTWPAATSASASSCMAARPSICWRRSPRRSRRRRRFWICSGTCARSTCRSCACSRRPRPPPVAITLSPPGMPGCAERVQPPDRSSADRDRARDLFARAQHGSGARQLDQGSARRRGDAILVGASRRRSAASGRVHSALCPGWRIGARRASSR